MVGGLAHKYVMNENTYIRSSLSATYSKDHTVVDQLADDKLIRVGDIRNSRWDFVFSSVRDILTERGLRLQTFTMILIIRSAVISD